MTPPEGNPYPPDGTTVATLEPEPTGGWVPVRKIAAAAVGAVLSFAGIAAWVAGDSELDWKALVAAAIAAAAPVLLGYLVPAKKP